MTQTTNPLTGWTDTTCLLRFAKHSSGEIKCLIKKPGPLAPCQENGMGPSLSPLPAIHHTHELRVDDFHNHVMP